MIQLRHFDHFKTFRIVLTHKTRDQNGFGADQLLEVFGRLKFQVTITFQ